MKKLEDKDKRITDLGEKENVTDKYCPECGGALLYSKEGFYCQVCGFSQEKYIGDL